MLGFLKRNLFNIICGVVSAASIGLGSFGLTSMGKVGEQLEDIRILYGQFSGASKRPLNDKTIAAERRRVETIERYYTELMERAKALNGYDPLPPPEGERFFPEPTDNGRRQFADIYEAEFPKLIEQLKAGGPPSAGDIQNAQETIDDERRAAEHSREDVDSGEDREDDQEEEEEEHPSGLITEKEARESAEARASIRRARSIYCYATRDSFDENMEVYQGLSPRPSQMWRAQLSLWIQQDVVDALARVNNRTAEDLKSQGQKPWVGVLPVKDLISMRVSGYVPVGSSIARAAKVRGEDPVDPPGKAETVFTKNKSTDLYEVVQFTLKMVVDVRALPVIIDEISKDRFHTLLNIAYVYERDALENLAMEGKVYGSQPSVKVLMDFESVFFGDPYRCMMPPGLLGSMGKECEKAEDD